MIFSSNTWCLGHTDSSQSSSACQAGCCASSTLEFHVIHAYGIASLTGLCYFAGQIVLMRVYSLVDLTRGALTDQRCYTMVRMHPPVQSGLQSALTKVQCPCQGMPAICSLFCAQACHSSDASCIEGHQKRFSCGTGLDDTCMSSEKKKKVYAFQQS